MNLRRVYTNERQTKWVVHISDPQGSYASACGLDESDEELGTFGDVPAKETDKVNCPMCIDLWMHIVAIKPNQIAKLKS